MIDISLFYHQYIQLWQKYFFFNLKEPLVIKYELNTIILTCLRAIEDLRLIGVSELIVSLFYTFDKVDLSKFLIIMYSIPLKF